MSFGWSVGDIIASINLLVKIGCALKETGGASSEYQESIEFLFGLEITLQNLQSIAPVLLPSPQQVILQLEIEKIAKPISKFFDRVQKLERFLGKESKKSLWKTGPRKIQWALQVSKEVKALRDSISVPIASINILLQSQALLAMSCLHEKLPREVADRLASRMDRGIDMSSGLREEVTGLKESMKSFEETQNNLTKEMIVTVDRSASREHHTLVALQQQLDRLPQEVCQRVIAENKDDSRMGSRFEQLMMEQSQDLKMICGSLTTMAECQQKASWSNDSDEMVISAHAALAELKSAFCKCIYLLAMSVRHLFNEAMLFLGPQFLLFLLAFKQFGIQAPRLLLGDRFLFEDVLGRQKYLPVEYFQHYTVFSSFLQKSFDGLPGQRYVSNRQFHLTDGKSNIIRSESWQKIILRRPKGKVTMTVVLDEVDDELVDVLACPRCSTSEPSARPDISVECSSCKLHYRTGNPYRVGTRRATKILDEASENTAPSPTPTPPIQDPIPNSPGPMKDDFEEIGEATVTDMRSTNMTRRVPALDPSATQKAPPWELPWDEEELKYFRRVQIPDLEITDRPSYASTLKRISLALDSLTFKSANLRNNGPTTLSNLFLNLMSESITCGDHLSIIAEGRAINLLPKEQQLLETEDWSTKLSSTAGRRLAGLAALSRKLLKVYMILYHEMKNTDHVGKGFEKRAKDQLDLTAVLIRESKSIQSSLLHLDEIHAAWLYGGVRLSRAIFERGIQEADLKGLEDEATNSSATCLEVTEKYIIIGHDNSSIWVFDHFVKTPKRLSGHIGGVWALAACGDILVSASTDRELRVWDMSTGNWVQVLIGHTSTVRCLKFIDKYRVVSGSRDTTLRIWDIKTGKNMAVLFGHTGSVHDLAVIGNFIVSGSYDTTARVWNLDEGRCLKVLTGHSREIYSVVTDGKRVFTGSLDTSIRVWDIHTGACEATLQGHTNLVGHLRLRSNNLVSGGSDGIVCVWSLLDMSLKHRLVGGENTSITCLQFDHNRIISGTYDGDVRVWDLATGEMIRELHGKNMGYVGNVGIAEHMAVVVRGRHGTSMVLEVWDFDPQEQVHPPPEEEKKGIDVSFAIQI